MHPESLWTTSNAGVHVLANFHNVALTISLRKTFFAALAKLGRISDSISHTRNNILVGDLITVEDAHNRLALSAFLLLRWVPSSCASFLINRCRCGTALDRMSPED